MITNIAHRGARSLAPENTLLAARRAFEIGADMWETDITITADHQLILMHDRTLHRTTNVAQCFPGRRADPVCRFTLQEIRSVDAGSWFLDQDPFGQIAAGALTVDQREACRGEKIPTLEEALAYTKERGWRINLELKSLPPELDGFPLTATVLAMVDRMGMAADQVIISSFNHNWLREIRALRPMQSIAALIGDFKDAPMDWGGYEFDIYNANHDLIDDAQIKMAHDHGKRVNIFTVNALSDMQHYIAMGIAGLFTDFPQRLKMLQ